MPRELCNGWCKHQDCSQPLCNLLLQRGVYKRLWSPWLPLCHHRDPVSGPPLLSTGGVVSGISHGHSVSLQRGQCRIHINNKPRMKQAWAKLLLFPAPHLVPAHPSWPAWSCRVWGEQSALGSLESAQLSLRQQGRKCLMENRDKINV